MKYEVVCTEEYLDVGLLVEIDGNRNPKKILVRNLTYNLGSYYGGIENLEWIYTGVFLSVEEWNKITFNKHTDQILQELNIHKKSILESTCKNINAKSISWYKLWERIGKQPLHKTKNSKVTVLINGKIKECTLVFTDNGSDFHLEIIK